MSYNKETDYQSKINEAVKNGDYVSAAQYEKSRNEKIDAEGLGYEKTNNYSGWLDNTDYSVKLKNQMSSGASKKEVADTLNKRIAKASGTQGLSQYASDDIYDRAISYIMGTDNSSSKEKKPRYENSYNREIKELLGELSKVKKFSYDPYEDDLYEYYKSQYVREGNRAMEDLLGELSASTGGVASSYAVSAAAQSRNYYNEKIADVIPKLYTDAYEKYLDEISRKEKNLEILSDLSDSEYKRYLGELDQYNLENEFEYEKYLDSVKLKNEEEERAFEKEEAEREYEYLYRKLQQEAEENSRKWKQQEYENQYESEQNKIENALSKWKNMGYLDAESAQILGLPVGLRTTDYDYKKAQQYKIYNK